MGARLAATIRHTGTALAAAHDAALRQPRETQAAVLRGLLERQQDTVYGRLHGFAGIRDPAAFVRQVPVVTCTDLAPYVERMKRGEPRILTADAPVLFGTTSGTTAAAKSIPITRHGLAAARHASALWLHGALRDHPRLLDRALAIITGSECEGWTTAGIPCGSVSGLIQGQQPRLLRQANAIPALVAQIADHDLRYHLITRLILARPVSFIATPNPSTLLRIARIAQEQPESIIRAIHDGVPWPTTTGASPGDGRLLHTLATALRPRPARARALERVVRRQGSLQPAACWPDLTLMGCWLGGMVGAQAARLAPCYGGTVAQRDLGYLASEGSMSIPLADGTPGGVLAIQHHVFEFVPADDATAPTLGCHELLLGGRYRVIISNDNGLYRYDLDDLIEVTGFHHRTPVVAFLRKGDDVVNLMGEKVHALQVQELCQLLETACGLRVLRFRMAPDPGLLRLELLLHLERVPDREVLQRTVLPFIDRTLAALNQEYAAKRRSRRLAAPCLHVMDDGWEDAVRRQALAAGQREVQYKWRPMTAALGDADRAHRLDTILPDDGIPP